MHLGTNKRAQRNFRDRNQSVEKQFDHLKSKMIYFYYVTGCGAKTALLKVCTEEEYAKWYQTYDIDNKK